MPPSSATATAYTLSGRFLEACDCQVLCPCWTGEPPDQDVCNGVFAWEVESGRIDGEDVEPFRVVSISRHAGNRADARQQVAVFVDYEGASADLLRRIVDLFAGRVEQGPLRELGRLLGELVNDPRKVADGDLDALVRRSIQLRADGPAFSLTVSDGNKPHVVETAGKTVFGERNKPITLTESSLSKALGTQGDVTVARSDRFQLFAPDFADSYWLDLDIRSRSATFGGFCYDFSDA